MACAAPTALIHSSEHGVKIAVAVSMFSAMVVICAVAQP
jgi:hypothetical protein